MPTPNTNARTMIVRFPALLESPERDPDGQAYLPLVKVNLSIPFSIFWRLSGSLVFSRSLSNRKGKRCSAHAEDSDSRQSEAEGGVPVAPHARAHSKHVNRHESKSTKQDSGTICRTPSEAEKML